MVVHQLPRNGAGGYGSQGMTQKQCDAYYMNDGTNCPGMNDVYKEFDGYNERYDSRPREEGYVETNELVDYPELGPLGTGVSKQYVQREPRFYASVGYNGSTWHLLNALNDNTHDEEKIYKYSTIVVEVMGMLTPLIGFAQVSVLKICTPK